MNDKKVFFSAAAGVAILICSISFGTNAVQEQAGTAPSGTYGLTAAIYQGIPGIFETNDKTGYSLEIREPYALMGAERNVVEVASRPAAGRRREEHTISPYDHVLRTVSEREGVDWRLIAAIAYNESRFKPEVVSKKGAKGLMQIMPVVSRQFGVPDEQVMEPEVNITLAVKLLNKIETMMQIPRGVHSYDRTALVLASYNCGIGHVSDARRLAAKYGADPNSWENVSEFLKKKSQPEYYQDGVVRSGRFRGSGQTLAFVDGVMGRYNSYCTLAAL